MCVCSRACARARVRVCTRVSSAHLTALPHHHQTCVIVDESHELFNEKSMRQHVRDDLYRMLASASRVFCLSGAVLILSFSLE